MKRTFTLFAAILLLAVGATAQKLSYQAVVRNTANELVYDAQVTVSLKILAADGATVQYAETQTATTNQNGLLTLIIGDNSSATGDLTTVVWADASIRTDITLPTGDVVTNIMPVTAVPYALYANDAGGNLDQIQSDWLETNMVSKAYIKNKPTLAPVATSGNYSDLSGTPNLAPVATSGSYGDLTGTPTLAPVATSGNYSDLNGTPNLAPVATSGNYSDLSGTPNLAPVATSGSYGDLTGTPTLAPVATSGNYGDLNGTPNLAPVATSGNYSDLSGTPNLAPVATSGNYSDLSGTPTLAPVATSGSYGDLTGTPTLAPVATSGNYSDLNGTPNLAPVATSGNYSDLSGTPNLAPVATSGSYGDLTGTPALAPVATSGNYSDLNGTPTIPDAQVNADWNATSGITQILNKPTLASVATSGSYSDLTGTPTIPAAQVNADWNATSGITQILNKPTLASVATSGSYGDLTGTPTLAPVATSGSYSDLTGTPTIPAAQVNADWNATSGITQILNKPTLASVATSGSYSDLTGTPTIPAAQVNADWNATSGITQILNKPTLASVATSGNYSDLSGAPDVYTKTETNNLLAGKANLSDIHNSTITIQKNGETVGSFTLNQSADQTINISVPTSEGSGTTIIQTISLSGNVLTLSDGGGQVTLPSETDPTVPSWAKSETKPVYDYSEITNTPTLPTIPANVSAFNNDNGYLTRDSIEVLQATVNNLVALVNSLNMRMYQEQFTAAAGQTIFTLEHAAKTNCIVRMYINGVMVGGNHNGVLEINENDATKVVYDASLNRNYNLKANDKVTIVYWY